MALGFPWKKKTRIEEEGEKKCRQDCNCMFHLGFHSAAKTIAPLERQISFHVRGPKARGGHRGGRGREVRQLWRDGRIQSPLIFPYNGTLMWRLLYGEQQIAQSAVTDSQSTKEALRMVHSVPPPLFQCTGTVSPLMPTSSEPKRLNGQCGCQGLPCRHSTNLQPLPTEIWIVTRVTLRHNTC